MQVASDAALDTTFECYYADTAKPVESVGFSNLLSKLLGESSTTASDYCSGRERRAEEWPALFAGLSCEPSAGGSQPRGSVRMLADEVRSLEALKTK